MSRPNGPDVSKWQGDVDWRKVRGANCEFAVVKATEGLDYVDPRFSKARIDAMEAAGLILSAYHFARPQKGRTGAQEADHFLKSCKSAGLLSAKGAMPLVLDIENTKLDKRGTQQFIASFVQRVFTVTGERPIIYTYPSFWTSKVGGDNTFKCHLWIAHYGVAKPTVPAPFKRWTFWQFTDKQRTPGVAGPADHNVFNGELADLKALVKHQPRPPAKPPKKPPKEPPKKPPASPHYPKGLAVSHRPLWDRPWDKKARGNSKFNKWLRDHGYLTPNFRINEARCKDGTSVASSTRLLLSAQRHAWNLERLRHRLGDRPIPILSWFRTPAYNKRIGGASKSKHMEAFATDHTREWANSIGRQKLIREGEIVFKNGGMGIYPAGSFHFDSRSGRARWSSF